MAAKKKSACKSAETGKKVQEELCPGTRIVKFRLEDAPGKTVYVSGNFNEWKLDTLMTDRKKDGVYTCQLRLAPGEYQYKFVVDGEWRLDGTNSNFAPNGFGELNSVLKVEEK